MQYLPDPYESTENEFHRELVNKIGKEHSVIIYFNYGLEEDEPFYELSEKLEKIVDENKLGIYDGHEIAMDNSDGSYYIYGPNAEAIFKAIKPLLESTPFMRGGTAVLTFGPTGTNSPQLELEI
jgi:hypothetical protein